MLVFDDRNYYRINLKRSVQLAVIAKIKRFFSPKIRKPKNKYIHIGCGFHRFEEFDNLDFYNSSFSFWKKKNYIPHDFKYKLPYEDNSFEGAFSGHTLEHLYFDEEGISCKIIHKEWLGLNQIIFLDTCYGKLRMSCSTNQEIPEVLKIGWDTKNEHHFNAVTKKRIPEHG